MNERGGLPGAPKLRSRLEAIVLTGPTASGKGGVAFELARKLDAEIVSVDSMKVYREMDVATAKPSAAQMQAVRYHLIDIIDPGEDFSAGQYLALLEKTLDDIAGRGRRAILCGGTALYLKAFFHGLQGGPEADWDLRSKLFEEAAAAGPEKLHERLCRLDPVAASKIHPLDLKRTVRALEVQAKTGRPLSATWQWAQTEGGRAVGGAFGLAWPRAELYRRIGRRVEVMVEKGLFQEAARLWAREPPLSRSASQSIGYKEVFEWMRGGCSDEERSGVVAAMQQRTRRFAKHQLTWFRRFPLNWIAVSAAKDPDRLPHELAGEIAAKLKSR